MSGRGVLTLAVALVTLSSCGYIGPVVPPSLHIPVPVTDLTAIQVGSGINLQLMLPQQTTDDSTVNRLRVVDLRIGNDPAPFDLGTWAEGATKIEVAPEAAESALSKTQPLKLSAPAAAWEGKRVAIAVRTAQRENHDSQWSNILHLRIVPALEAPEIKPESADNGVKIAISSFPSHGKVRILRQGPNDQQPLEAGVADGPEYVDRDAQYGTRYIYTAVAFDNEDHANAVSRESQPQPLTPEDKFAPSVPSGITVLASASSVEVSWERSPETDTKGYYVSRSMDGAPFERIGEMATVPAFSDKSAQHGKKYRYQVSAVDVRNNESKPSAPVEVAF